MNLGKLFNFPCSFIFFYKVEKIIEVLLTVNLRTKWGQMSQRPLSSVKHNYKSINMVVVFLEGKMVCEDQNKDTKNFTKGGL